ncbi:MAG: hypothetical protein U1F49_04755 [Rubrivivax sp.]
MPKLLLEGVFDQPLAAWADDLPDGRYELRVRAGDADGIEGHMARRAFTLKARPEPPFLLRPRAGEKTTDEQVTLAWARNPQAARYRLQVAPSADFATPSIARDDLAETELRWCCRWARRTIGKMCAADGDQGPWGDARALERVAQPPFRRRHRRPAASRRRPRRGPSPSTGRPRRCPAPPTRCRSRDEAFTQIVLDERTPRTEARCSPSPTPVQHARVRTIGADDGRAGGFGSAQQVEAPGSSLWWLWPLPLLLLLLRVGAAPPLVHLRRRARRRGADGADAAAGVAGPQRLDAQLRPPAPRSASLDVIVVDIDDASLAALKPQFGPWPFKRDVYALVIEQLRDPRRARGGHRPAAGRQRCRRRGAGARAGTARRPGAAGRRRHAPRERRCVAAGRSRRGRRRGQRSQHSRARYCSGRARLADDRAAGGERAARRAHAAPGRDHHAAGRRRRRARCRCGTRTRRSGCR